MSHPRRAQARENNKAIARETAELCSRSPTAGHGTPQENGNSKNWPQQGASPSLPRRCQEEVATQDPKYTQVATGGRPVGSRCAAQGSADSRRSAPLRGEGGPSTSMASESKTAPSRRPSTRSTTVAALRISHRRTGKCYGALGRAVPQTPSADPGRFKNIAAQDRNG